MLEISPLPPGHQWFVGATDHQQEERVDAAWRAKGFATFYPTHIKIVRHARKTTQVRRPLYEGYTFVAFDRQDTDQFDAILHTRGVDRLLGMERRPGRPLTGSRPGQHREFIAGKHPQPMPERIVARLLEVARLHEGSIPLGAGGLAELSPGDRVRVIEGPFESFEALVQANDRGRVWALLDIFGRKNKTSFPRDSLVAIA